MDVIPAGFTVRLAFEADLGAIQGVDALSFPPEEQYENEFYTAVLSETRFQALSASFQQDVSLRTRCSTSLPTLLVFARWLSILTTEDAG